MQLLALKVKTYQLQGSTGRAGAAAKWSGADKLHFYIDGVCGGCCRTAGGGGEGGSAGALGAQTMLSVEEARDEATSTQFFMEHISRFHKVCPRPLHNARLLAAPRFLTHATDCGRCECVQGVSA
jgi:hypothetical protein